MAQEHFGVGAFVLGVVLESGPLEILHGVFVASCRAGLADLFGDRIAELGEAAVARPIAKESEAQRVAGLREIGVILPILKRLDQQEKTCCTTVSAPRRPGRTL